MARKEVSRTPNKTKDLLRKINGKRWRKILKKESRKARPRINKFHQQQRKNFFQGQGSKRRRRPVFQKEQKPIFYRKGFLCWVPRSGEGAFKRHCSSHWIRFQYQDGPKYWFEHLQGRSRKKVQRNEWDQPQNTFHNDSFAHCRFRFEPAQILVPEEARRRGPQSRRKAETQAESFLRFINWGPLKGLQPLLVRLQI